jgi:hypothetical protein
MPLNGVSIDCPWVYFLVISNIEYLDSCDMVKQQGLDTTPSLACKKNKNPVSLISHPLIVQSPLIQKPIQSLQKLCLPLNCILRTIGSIFSITDTHHTIPVCAKITNVSIHTFLTKVEYNLIIIHHISDHSSG